MNINLSKIDIALAEVEKQDFPADDREIERLKWRSRRGLLELDLFFTRFWQKEGQNLDEKSKRSLAKLLDLSDNDILDMILQRQTCNDEGIRELIYRLQQA